MPVNVHKKKERKTKKKHAEEWKLKPTVLEKGQIYLKHLTPT